MNTPTMEEETIYISVGTTQPKLHTDPDCPRLKGLDATEKSRSVYPTHEMCSYCLNGNPNVKPNYVAYKYRNHCCPSCGGDVYKGSHGGGEDKGPMYRCSTESCEMHRKPLARTLGYLNLVRDRLKEK